MRFWAPDRRRAGSAPAPAIKVGYEKHTIQSTFPCIIPAVSAPPLTLEVHPCTSLFDRIPVPPSLAALGDSGLLPGLFQRIGFCLAVGWFLLAYNESSFLQFGEQCLRTKRKARPTLAMGR